LAWTAANVYQRNCTGPKIVLLGEHLPVAVSPQLLESLPYRIPFGASQKARYATLVDPNLHFAKLTLSPVFLSQ
jgi:hypothetical protein